MENLYRLRRKFSVGDHSYNSDNACETCGYSTVYTKGLKYELNEGTDTYILTGIGEAKDTTDLIIPAYYEGKAVTSIGDWAFSLCSSLTNIEIPDSVTELGRYAFYKCIGLKSIEIPDSVASIGSGAFQYCSGLTSAIIPDGVTSIGALAFKGTAYFNDAANWDSSGVLYIGNHLIEAKKDIISGSYTVKQGTKTIAEDAFAGGEESGGTLYLRGCLNLTSIVIPNSVTSVGDGAFAHCSELTSIEIPNSVTSISDHAFNSCSKLASIVIPDSVTLIGNYAFRNCSGLMSVTIGDGVTEIGDYAFDNCRNLTDIEIPDSVTTIGASAFDGCSGLTGELKIPDSVTLIGIYAFRNCNGLKSVTIGSGVTRIGDSAFEDCRGLTRVDITNLAAWCKIDFRDFTSNPLPYADHLYLDEEERVCSTGTVFKGGVERHPAGAKIHKERPTAS